MGPLRNLRMGGHGPIKRSSKLLRFNSTIHLLSSINQGTTRFRSPRKGMMRLGSTFQFRKDLSGFGKLPWFSLSPVSKSWPPSVSGSDSLWFLGGLVLGCFASSIATLSMVMLLLIWSKACINLLSCRWLLASTAFSIASFTVTGIASMALALLLVIIVVVVVRARV